MDHSLQHLGAHLCQQVHPQHQPAITHFGQHPSSSIHPAKANERFLPQNFKSDAFYTNEKDVGVTKNDDDDDDDDEEGDGNEDEDDEQLSHLIEEKEHHDGDGRIVQEATAWHRTKWTNDMVVLLIQIVHFVGEDGPNNIDNSSVAVVGSKRKSSSLLQKKGKWRLVSTKMNEAKCYVSPQQCEDKFNDLNKRYKRLNDVLGKEMALEIVNQPSLLDSMSNLSSKTKDDVKKILTSKHTFYKEMYSFYNGFEHKPCLQPMTLLGEQGAAGVDTKGEILLQKNAKECEDNTSLEKHYEESNRVLPISLFHESNIADKIVVSRMLELQRRKVGIQAQTLELEKRHFKWQKHCAGRDIELEKLKEENRRMKAENDRLSLLLKVKKVEAEHKEGSVSSMTSG